MIDTPSPSISFDAVALQRAIDAVHEPDRALAELEAVERDLLQAEPSLLKKIASGDVQAAAQLTVNRVKLKECIPQERHDVDSRRLDTCRGLWQQNNAATAAGLAIAEATEISAKERLREVADPLLRDHLVHFNVGWDGGVRDHGEAVDLWVSHNCQLTRDGRRAGKLMSDLKGSSGDFSQYQRAGYESARFDLLQRAQSILKAWQAFQAAG